MNKEAKERLNELVIDLCNLISEAPFFDDTVKLTDSLTGLIKELKEDERND